jgi:zona occludens toxin (predicted ATPase)
MRTRALYTSLLAASFPFVFGACGGSKAASDTSTSQVTTDTTLAQSQPVAAGDTTYQHHSVLGGAVAGAAAGHVLGHHAIAGAAVGALVQHERNKHEAASH